MAKPPPTEQRRPVRGYFPDLDSFLKEKRITSRQLSSASGVNFKSIQRARRGKIVMFATAVKITRGTDGLLDNRTRGDNSLRLNLIDDFVVTEYRKN